MEILWKLFGGPMSPILSGGPAGKVTALLMLQPGLARINTKRLWKHTKKNNKKKKQKKITDEKTEAACIVLFYYNTN